MEAPDYNALSFPLEQTLKVAIRWVRRHCVVPDGFDRGAPFALTGWQRYFFIHHYRVKPTAKWNPAKPLLAPAFHYRRSQVVLPQKAGKAPLTSAQICLEGVGPALFAGWAKGGEVYTCDGVHTRCRCGWTYTYAPGEAMGMHWPTPEIQVTATSEEQTGNIYRSLRPMIEYGLLSEVIPKTGEEFIRLPGGGRIDVVTSSATSRLGQRVTFVCQDETGVWTHQNKMDHVHDTQRRGLAGMGGRSCETTNAWDPTIDSVAKATAEAKAKDIFRLHPMAPDGLDYKVKRDRERIHAYVYDGSPWVDLDAIEAEAAELLEKDPAQAERFFGNRVVAGSGKAFNLDRWKELAAERSVPAGARVVVGFDGSKFDDATAMVGTELETGHQWVIGIWYPEDFPPNEFGEHEIDTEAVTAALSEVFTTYKVWRVYADPPRWQDVVASWAGRWGEKRVYEWWTNRPKAMAYALQGYRDAITSGDLTHDGNEHMAAHVGNAVRVETNIKDDEGKPLWLIQKEAPKSPLKIDAAMAGVLSWEARSDAVAAGAIKPRRRAIGF